MIARSPLRCRRSPRTRGSAAAASQVIGSPYRFTRPTGASQLFMLTQGYGVMDNPTMPIVAKDGKVAHVGVEAPGAFEVSGADAVLAVL